MIKSKYYRTWFINISFFLSQSVCSLNIVLIKSNIECFCNIYHLTFPIVSIRIGLRNIINAQVLRLPYCSRSSSLKFVKFSAYFSLAFSVFTIARFKYCVLTLYIFSSIQEIYCFEYLLELFFKILIETNHLTLLHAFYNLYQCSSL